MLEGFDDVKEGDVLEVYEIREVERTELDDALVGSSRLE